MNVFRSSCVFVTCLLLLPALPAGAAMPVISSAAIAGSGAGADALLGIGRDDSGNVYVAGYLTQAGTGKDIWLGKYSPELVQLTTYTFDKAGFDDAAWAVVVDTDVGGVYVAGYVSSAAATSGRDIWVARFDDSLVLVASATFNGAGDDADEALGLRVYDGALYVVGYSSAAGGRAIWLGGYHLETLELVLSTSVIRYGAAGYAVMPVASGNIFVAGTAAPDAAAPGEAWIGKFDGEMVLLASTTVNGPSPGADEYRRLAGGDDGFVAVGFLNAATGATRFMQHYDASLTALSSAVFNGPGGSSEFFSDVQILEDGTFLVAGSISESAGDGGVNGLLGELSDEFVMASSTTLRSAGSGADHLYSLLLGSGDDAYAVGWAQGSDQDALLARFSTLLPNPAYPGCVSTENVGSQYRHETIQEAVNALPATLTGHACVVIRDGATYAEEVTVSGFVNDGSSITLLADPASGLTPAVSPPAASTAAFLIANASVNVQGIDVVPANAIAYGVFISSAYVKLSSVNVKDAGGNIWTAGVAASSWTTLSHASVTVGGAAATALWLPGSVGTSVSFSSAAANGAAAFALRLTGASFNTVTETLLVNLPGSGAYLLNSNGNTISRSSIACDNGTGSNAALHLSNSSSNTVTGIFARNWFADAVKLVAGSNYNTLSQSTAVLRGSGGQAALSLSSSHSNSVSGCMLNGSGGPAALLGSSNHNTIGQTTMTVANGMGAQALRFNVASSNTISQSYIANSADTAVSFWNGSSYNSLGECTVIGGPSSNADPSGIHLLNGSYNTIDQSLVSNPGGHGATFGGAAVRNTISQSTITSGAAGYSGLYFLSGSATNSVTGSYIQGSTAAYIIGANGAAIDASVLAGGALGPGVFLDAGSSGEIAVTSNVITGARYGLLIAAQPASLTLSNLTFAGLASGATAVTYLGGTFVSTITAASFDDSAAVNVNGASLNAASRVTMKLSSGTRTGPLYENDPLAVVDWPGAAPAPSTPTAFGASGVGQRTATIAWTSGGNLPGTVYELERSSGTGFGLRQSSTALSLSEATLSAAATYYYRVRAINDDLVASAYASTITVVTFPVPVPLAVNSVTPSSAAAWGGVPLAAVGTGFDGTAAVALERRPAEQGVWTATGAFTNARMLGTMTKLFDGRLLLAGGMIEGSALGLAYADIFDPATGAWTATTPMLQGRNQHAAVLLADGRVLVSGGWGPAGAIISSSEIYDSASQTWTPAATMSGPAVGHQMALLADGRVLSAGGDSGSGKISAAERFDPDTDAWTSAGSMSAGRMFAAMTVLRDGRVLVSGDSGGTAASSTSELYDPAGNSWSMTGAMNSSRYAHRTLLLPDGRVLAASGSNGTAVVDTADVYDPATGFWTATSTMAAGRLGHALVAAGGGALAIGGESNPVALASTELYDPATNSWRAGPALLGVRAYPLAAVLDDGGILVASGRLGYAGSPAAATAEVLVVPASSITATGVVVGDAQNLSGTFALTGAATGYWDLAVRQAGGRVGRLIGGFLAVLPSTPAAPSGFSGTALSTGAIRWTWSDNTAYETGYRVMSGAVDLSGELPIDATSWLQTGLSTGTSYGPYFARAFNAGGPSDSATASRATLAAPAAGLLASGVGQRAATIGWTDGGNPAGTLYHVERSTDGAFGLRQSSTALSFVDATLSAASTYYYRVRALNPDLAASSYTSSITVVTLPAPVPFAVASIAPSSAVAWGAVPAALVGTGFDGTTVPTLERLPASQGVWTATGSFANPRMLGTLTKLFDGRLLLAGGMIEGSAVGLAYADVYDPATGTWTATTPMNQGRNQHAATLLSDGRVLVSGGKNPAGTISNTSEIYDPASATWTPAGSLATPTHAHQMALLPDGRVLSAGGDSGSGKVSAAERFDPDTNAWTSAGSMSAGRVLHAMTVLRDGRVLVSGDSGGTAASSTAELYDSAGNSWSMTGAMNASRYEHATALLADGRVLASAGSNGTAVVNTAEVYDPATGFWTATSTMAAGRLGHELAATGGGALAIGGQSDSAALASTELYDSASNSWHAGPALLGVRTYPMAATLDDGKVLVAGGRLGYAGSLVAATAEVLVIPVSSITAAGVVVGDAQNVSGTFDLTGASTGYWDAVVSRSDGRAARLTGGFQALLLTTPTASSGFSGAAQSTGSILWSWSDGSTNELGFRVMSGAANLSGDLPAGTTAWLQAGLSTATAYGPYFARAFNGAGTADSATASRATLSAPPETLAVSGVGLGGATLSWAAGGNPAGTVYELERSSGTGFGRRLSTTALSSFDLPLAPASTYYYRVRALNPDLAASAYASSITVVTPPVPVYPAPVSVTPSSGAIGTSVPAAIAGGGFDASAAMSLEMTAAEQGVWTATGSFTQARFLGMMRKLRDGRVLLAGGLVEGVGVGRAEADVFDPATGAWSATAPLRQGRYEFASVVLADGRVLVSGGVAPGTIVASAEIYDPALSTWTAAAPMSSVRQGHELALLPDGRVLAAGGWTGGVKLSAAEIYDPATDAWTAAPAMGQARAWPAMTVLRDGKVLVSGDSGSSAASTTAEVYDPVGNAWTPTGAMGASRSEHAALLLSDGRVLAAGGRGASVTSTADVYDPATGLWTSASTMAAARFAHALVWAGGAPLAVGGLNSSAALATTEIYDVALNAWRAGPALAAGTRAYPRAAVLDDGTLLAAGGRQGLGGGATLDTAEVLVMPSSQITATGVSVTNAQNMSGTFDLSAAATGYWDLVVRQSGGRTGRLGGGFLSYFPSSPTAPSGFAGVAQSPGSILWSWTDNSINETGFRVMSGAVNLSGDLPAGTTAWLQAGLSTATSYGPYFARAYNLGGVQDSATATRATLAAVPNAPAPSAVGLGGATLSWAAAGNPAGAVYELERSSGTGFGRRLSTTSLSSFDLPLAPASTYYYRVRALNPDLVASAYTSSIAIVTPPVPVYPAPASITPSSGAIGTSVAAAIAGGGFDASASLSLERAHVPGGTWAATGSFAQGRFENSLTTLRDGRVLMAGGQLAGLTTGWAYVDLYDPATGAWTAGPPLNQGRYAHDAVMLADGRVLVAGGLANGTIASVEIYDPAINAWTPAAPMSDPRYGPHLALLADGRVLAAGGSSGVDVLSSAEIYDPAADSWTQASSMNEQRNYAAISRLDNGKVLVAGGWLSGTAEVYDPGTNAWTAAGTMSAARQGLHSVVLGDGKVLVAGGNNGAAATAATDVYDPAANTWTTASPMAAARRGFALVTVNATPLAIAGETTSTSLASTEIFDAESNAWQPGPSLLATRSYLRAVVLVDGRVLAAGALRTPGDTNLNTAELLSMPTSQILATGAAVTDAQNMSGTFDLTGAATGYWDIVVRQSGDRVGRLTGGFLAVSTPAAPAGFSGAAASASAILWTWTDASGDESGFRVSSGAVNLSGDLPAGTTSWLQSGLGANVLSGPLFVRAFNIGGTADSSTATRTTLAEAPGGLAASGVAQTSGTVVWSPGLNPAGTVYRLERSTGTGFGLRFAGAATTYFEASLSPAATYYYRALALNAESVATAYSTTFTLITLPMPALPGAAGAPAGTALGTSSISWTWALASGATSHNLFRASDDAYLSSSAAGPFTLAALSPNVAYGLRAAGVNLSGAGPLSAAATAYTLAALPSGGAAASITSTTLVASWGLNGNPGSTVAELQRSTDAVAFSTLTAAAVTSYADADLLGCTTYYYRVRHVNGDGLPTAFASFQGVTANTIPGPPSGLTANANAGATVSLAWGLSGTEGVTGYRLFWDAGTGTVAYGAPLAVFGSTATGYTTGVLVSSASYTFALRAAHRCGVVETAGALAMSGASLTVPAVRAVIKAPASGRRIDGNRVTLLGELVAGTPSDVQQVRFQYKAAASSVWLDVPAANINHGNPDLSFPYFTHWDVTALAAGDYDLRAVAYDLAAAPDAAPSAVRVAVDPVAPDISESLTVDGKIKKDQTISNLTTSVVETAGASAGDPAVRVTIPPGAVNTASATVSVISNPAIATAAPSGQTMVGSAIQIGLSNGQSALNGTAAIVMTYPDTVLFPSLLQIFYLDTATGEWSRDFATTVDAASRTVSGGTPHFSTFVLMQGTPLSAGLDSVQAYPVPYKPNGSNPDEGRPFTHGDPNSGIIFANLAAGSVIKIYTLTGRLVTGLDQPGITGTVRWDAKNQDGRDVASGAYFALISAPGSKSVVKKLVIIR